MTMEEKYEKLLEYVSELAKKHEPAWDGINLYDFFEQIADRPSYDEVYEYGMDVAENEEARKAVEILKFIEER